MKVLDVALFHEGLERNTTMLQRLGDEMAAIQKATDGLIAMDDALKGEGGNAIRAFYEECHLPFLQFYEIFQRDFISTLEQIRNALDSLEPHPSGFIRENFLETEIEQGLIQIAQITESLTDESNNIMNQVADIVGLPRLDDSDVQEGVQHAKIRRNDTVQALHEFDSSQTSALIPIETSLATLENWLSNIESLFTDSTADIDFPMGRWAGLSANHPLKTELARENGMLMNTLLAPRHPFHLTSEFVEGPYANSLYDTYIYTTFPGMLSRAKLGVSKEESGFIYSFKNSVKKSWGSIREIGKDAVDGFKARGDKSFDSVYDFVNHGTFGMLDSIWVGSQERSAKKWDSTSDFFNYVTAGFTGMVEGTVNPDDSFSKEHWLNSFGLATAGVGVGRVTMPKPTSGVNGKAKETGPVVGEKIKKRTDIGDKQEGWNINPGGGNINGRRYSQHALERMAPDIPEVRAALSNRAAKKADELGYKTQTQEYSIFIKKYVDPRNIPPTVIEDAIKHTEKMPGNRKGTFIHETRDVKVIINEVGDVITVIPK